MGEEEEEEGAVWREIGRCFEEDDEYDDPSK